MLSKTSKRASSISLSGIRKIAEYARGLRNGMFLNVGEPDFTTPEHIKEAAKKAMEGGFTHYTPIQGIPELREAIAEKLRSENGIDVETNSEILITAGAQSAFFATCQALIDQGDEVIVQDPFYPAYEVALRLVGAKIVRAPLKEHKYFVVEPEDIEEKITKKTKVIILISPNNPTGSVLEKNTLKRISEVVRDNDLVVISDEIYEKIIYDGVVNHSVISVPSMEERTVIINSFSKTYAMTGWRVGFLVACKEIMENIVKVHHTMNICACAVSQKAALAALTGPQDCVVEMVREYDERRKEIVNLLNEIPGFTCQMPKGAFYVFPSINLFKTSSMEFAKFLIEDAGVVTVPGSAFGENGEGHLRLSYATSLENIREALSRIKNSAKLNWQLL